jgi:alkanesulfonate monooxygenase
MVPKELTVIGSCPTLRPGQRDSEYSESLRAAAMLAEKHGWAAMLIYSDNKQIDPWLAAHVLLENSHALSPLVAIQPLYMHPVTVAKSVASLSTLYDRPIHLNFVSGGLPMDLNALCDEATHDERYDRLREYGTIIRQLVSSHKPYSYAGKYYKVRHIEMWPPVPSHCTPLFTISGSSPAGAACAKQIGARAIQYLKPSDQYSVGQLDPGIQHGTRVGIIARGTSEAAWIAARGRFPENPVGAKIRDYFSHVSDSVWVKELNALKPLPGAQTYWLGPFKNNQAACPFLVGSFEAVAAELAGYIRLGLRTFLLEHPLDDEDADQISMVFQLAGQIANEQSVSN